MKPHPASCVRKPGRNQADDPLSRPLRPRSRWSDRSASSSSRRSDRLRGRDRDGPLALVLGLDFDLTLVLVIIPVLAAHRPPTGRAASSSSSLMYRPRPGRTTPWRTTSPSPRSRITSPALPSRTGDGSRKDGLILST